MSSIDGITAQIAVTQQAIALSVLKKSAEADQQIANILEQAANNIPASSSRGTVVNLTA